MFNARCAAAASAGGSVRLAPAELEAKGKTAGRWQARVYDPTLRFRLVAMLLAVFDLVGLLRHIDLERVRRMPWARKLRTVRDWDNLVTTAGENYLLSTGLGGGAPTGTWYLGLTDGTPTVAAGDTMASHAGWTEVVAYTEANRQTWTPGAAASGSIDNSGSVATVTINADGTVIGGAFLGSSNTKSGTTGTLYAAGAFSGGDLTLNNGSTLDLTATFSV